MGIAPALTRYASERRSGAASSAAAAQPRFKSGRARKRRRVRWPQRPSVVSAERRKPFAADELIDTVQRYLALEAP